MQDRLCYPLPLLAEPKSTENLKIKTCCFILQHGTKCSKRTNVFLPSPPHQLKKKKNPTKNRNVVATQPISPKAKQLCHKRGILFTQKKSANEKLCWWLNPFPFGGAGCNLSGTCGFSYSYCS